MFRFDRRLFASFDWVMVILLLLICGMALFNLYSASYPPKTWGIPPYLKQCYFFLLGFVVIIFILFFDYQELYNWNWLFYAIVIGLLIAILIVGKTAGGSQRWISLGFFNLQPSELAKLMLVISLASYYSGREVTDGYTPVQLIMPILLTTVPFLLILIQPDLGTALMLLFIAVSMTLFVKLRLSVYGLLGGGSIGCVYLAWNYLLKPYQKQRVLTFLNPEQDPMGHGYHIIQSKIAVGSGGQFGKGYLEGTQSHLHFLPERHTDFAFAVWCEEWGFFGSLFFIGIYFFFLVWALYTSIYARDRFGVLLSFGIVMLIFWQAIINLMMILGFLPVVGIPLPLVSYGGSSLLTTLAAIGILLNVRMRRFQGKMAAGE
ncbi:MAG: rod shape-determining protein RodA [Desulfobacterales bacterium]|nr:MAG: rod shape-determining protein RodA [Desulfobacterales bacterium]